MIIDLHTHTFPDRIAAAAVEKLKHASHTMAFTDGTMAQLKSSMQAAGIDYSVVLPVATNPLKVSSMNDLSMQLTGHDGLIYFGCMHPDCECWHAELKRIADAGLKGIKIHPVYQGVDIDDIRFLRILGRAAEVGLTVIMHAGDDIGFPGVVRCNPGMIANAVKQTGNVKLILAHMGGWRNWCEVEEILPQTSVCIDTAFSLGMLSPLEFGYYNEEELQLLKTEEFCRLVRAFGSERVFFGTDSPWSAQKKSLEDVRNLPLTETEKQNILGENARRLLNLG